MWAAAGDRFHEDAVMIRKSEGGADMLTIWKYETPATLDDNAAHFMHEFTLHIPDPGIVTRMGIQPSRSRSFVVWALVDPESSSVRERHFLFLGTGHMTGHTRLQFIDAWITDGLVFHLFEIEGRDSHL